jgi:fucose 4-O-acetylase-like acetyltransferase
MTEAGFATVGTESGVANTSQRELAIDSLRGVAILMVIGIHSLHQPLDSVPAKAVDAILRPAVPLFLFASGYLSARTRHVPILKRLKAALVPYTIAFVAAYLYMALHNPEMDHRPWIALARYGLGYVFVYYYVPVYIGCTFALWLLFKTCDRASQDAEARLATLLVSAILIGLVAGSYLDPLMIRIGASGELIEEARLRDLPFWFAFMALGVLARTVNARQFLAGSIPLLSACTVVAYVIYAAVRILSLGDAAAYDSIAFFAYAALLCLTCVAAAPRNVPLGFIGSGSYFIYLWHIFVIMLLRDHAVWQGRGDFISIATYAATAAASLLALFIVRSALPPRAARWLGA